MTVDPTSSLGEVASEEDAPQCDTCSEPIVNEPTHRVITWIEDDTTKTKHFCDDTCLSMKTSGG